MRGSVTIYSGQFFSEEMKKDFLSDIIVPEGWIHDGTGMKCEKSLSEEQQRKDVYKFMRDLSDYMDENNLDAYAEVDFFRGYNTQKYGVRRGDVIAISERVEVQGEALSPFPQDASDFDWRTEITEINAPIINRAEERKQPKHVSDVLGKVMAELQQKVDERGYNDANSIETDGIEKN